MAHDDAMDDLARQIEAAIKRDHLAKTTDQIVAIRRRGASEIHAICAAFVASVNSRLPAAAVTLSPPAYNPDMFRSSGVNLIQIGSRDRQVHIAFQATQELVSTQKYLIPYVLEGEIRAFNQKMLERFELRTQLLFFCLEDETASWRFFDWRTNHTGAFDGELLLSIMSTLFT